MERELLVSLINMIHAQGIDEISGGELRAIGEQIFKCGLVAYRQTIEHEDSAADEIQMLCTCALNEINGQFKDRADYAKENGIPYNEQIIPHWELVWSKC